MWHYLQLGSICLDIWVLRSLYYETERVPENARSESIATKRKINKSITEIPHHILNRIYFIKIDLYTTKSPYVSVKNGFRIARTKADERNKQSDESSDFSVDEVCAPESSKYI